MVDVSPLSGHAGLRHGGSGPWLGSESREGSSRNVHMRGCGDILGEGRSRGISRSGPQPARCLGGQRSGSPAAGMRLWHTAAPG